MRRFVSILLSIVLCLSFSSIALANKKEGDYVYSVKNKSITIEKYQGEETGEIIVPDTIDGKPVRIIASNAFEWCQASSIVLPNTITEIQNDAFYHAEAKDIRLPDSTLKIKGAAFMGCKNLQEFYIPANTTFEGENAFRGCQGLKCFTVDPQNKYYMVFNNALVEIKTMKLIAYPLTLVGEIFVIPYGIKIIGDTAFGFESPRNMKKLIIPDTVNTIGSSAFCFSNLEEIQIGAGLKKTGYGPFSYCKKLKKVLFTDGASIIGYHMFNNCPNLELVAIPNSVKKIDNTAFDEVDLVQFAANKNSKAAQYAKRNDIEVVTTYDDYMETMLSENNYSNEKQMINVHGFEFKIPEKCVMQPSNDENVQIYVWDNSIYFTMIHVAKIDLEPVNLPSSDYLDTNEEALKTVLNALIIGKKNTQGLSFKKYEATMTTTNTIPCNILRAVSGNVNWDQVAFYYNGNLMLISYITLTRNSEANNAFNEFIESIRPVQ